MTYEELQRILGGNQSTDSPPANLSLADILSGIQSQYQQAPMTPLIPGVSGAQRFASGKADFGPIEQITEYGQNPVAQAQSSTPMTSFVPGAFDINKILNIPVPNAYQMASQSGTAYQAAPMSAQQEAVFNFMNTPEGQQYKDAFGAANSRLLGSAASTIVPGAGLLGMVFGKSVNPLTAYKDASKAWDSAVQAMQSSLTNYGVSPNAIGPTTPIQAEALATILASQLPSSSSSNYGSGWYSSNDGGVGMTTQGTGYRPSESYGGDSSGGSD
jgi:hypothetical protein